MALPAFNRTIVDDAGNILAGASVEVRLRSTLNLASIFSDRDGAVGISNPTTADSNGFVQFYVAAGRYRVTATDGSTTLIWDDVVIGIPSDEMQLAARSVYARADATAGTAASLAASNDGEVLQRAAGILVFAPSPAGPVEISTPSALAAGDNDDFDAGIDGTIGRVELQGDAGGSVLTGMQGGTDGQRVVATNTSANTITLRAEDTGSTAANRFAMNGDMLLPQNCSVQFLYTQSRWSRIGW